MKVTGLLIFLVMACFDKIARGGLRPFFDWISEHSDPATLWRSKLNPVHLSSSLMVGIDFFMYVIPFLKPRVYQLGIIHQRPIVAYSDAEWTANHPPLLPSRGLGGCVITESLYRSCSTVTPTDILFSLAPRQTQIIPLELIAAIGLIHTFPSVSEGKEVIFFIDNQSVCGALTKGISHSRDIQFLSTGFHAMCAKIGCKVWIEWVPSKSNPADILSREHVSEKDIEDKFEDTQYKSMDLPVWVNQQHFDRIELILEEISGGNNGRLGCPASCYSIYRPGR